MSGNEEGSDTEEDKTSLDYFLQKTKSTAATDTSKRKNNLVKQEASTSKASITKKIFPLPFLVVFVPFLLSRPGWL